MVKKKVYILKKKFLSFFFPKALRKLWLKFRTTKWSPATAALYYNEVTAIVHKAIEKNINKTTSNVYTSVIYKLKMGETIVNPL